MPRPVALRPALDRARLVAIGLLSTMPAGVATAQVMHVGQGIRVGQLTASDAVGGGASAGYQSGPFDYAPIAYSNVIVDGPETAALNSSSHWINLSPNFTADGFTLIGTCYASIGPGTGTATSQDSFQIDFDISGIQPGSPVPFQLSGAISNTYGSTLVRLTGPAMNLVVPQGMNTWNMSPVLYNDGTYSLIVQMSASLVNATGPDFGQVDYGVTLKRLPVLPNDECDGAITITPGTIPFTTVGATGSTPMPEGCWVGEQTAIFNEVFYRYVAPIDGAVTVSTCDATTFDTWMAVLGGPCDAPVVLGCNDDACDNLGSSVTFDATAGEAYTIVLGGIAGATGSGLLSVSLPRCADATAIAPGVIPVASNPAAADFVLPADCASYGVTQISAPTYYRYVAQTSGTATVTTCGTVDFDTFLAAFTGSCDAPSVVACNDDTCGSASTIAFATQCGETYTIVVGGWYGATGTGTMTLTQDVGNTTCSGAIPVEPGTVSIDNRCATESFPLPATCASSEQTAISAATYFRYTAVATGEATFSLCGTANYDSWLAAFTGPCEDPAVLACNDDACGTLQSSITIPTTCGETYTIVVGGWAGWTGTGTMQISQTGVCGTPCPADVTLDGVVDASDLALLLGAWGTSGTAADLDHDGSVSAGDLAILLGAWGPCGA